jgi:hypothetical protein
MKIIFAVVALMLTFSVAAHSQVGAEFTTRDPIGCPQITGDQPPTMCEAQALIACDLEGVVTDWIRLTSDIQITSSSERAYDYAEDGAYSDIDPTLPVYNIAGSYVEYACGHPSQFDDSAPAGQTCMSGMRPSADGACYRMNSGYWACHWVDSDHGNFDQQKIPAPQ